MSSIPSTATSQPQSAQTGGPAWDVALLFPEQGSWTESDYLGLGTNRLVEFSDGCIEVLPMPTKLHQRLVRALFLLLQQFVADNEPGEVFFAPLPIRLWGGKYREPDIVFVRPERPDYRGQPDGADLVIEVVSEGAVNRERDLEIKREEYARAGISEYWIVDPERHEVIVLSLNNGQYQQHGVFGIANLATSAMLPGFEISVADLFVGVR